MTYFYIILRFIGTYGSSKTSLKISPSTTHFVGCKGVTRRKPIIDKSYSIGLYMMCTKNPSYLC